MNLIKGVKSLLVIPTLVLSCYSLDSDNKCSTPIGEPGQCVPSQQCKFMLDLQRIYRKKIPDAIQNQIEQMTCKVEPGSNFHLCCPIKSLKSDIPDSQPRLIEEPNLQNLSYINPMGLDLLNSFTSVCGVSPPEEYVAFGQPTSTDEFPWLVSLKYDTYGHPFLCGGSLITDQFVLTAAHCTTSAAKLITVHMGEHIVENESDCISRYGPSYCVSNYKEYAIEDIRPHPLYKKSAISYDIALIKLVQAVKFKSNISPICLPIEKSLQDIPKDQKFYISGWGLTEENVASPILLWAMVQRQDLDVCRKYFLDAPVTKNHICAVGNGKQHTCQGDSGGPLFYLKLSQKMNSFRNVQYGIVSFGGRHCGVNEGQPGIFASVIDMLPWITQNLY